eukprot:3426067-Rhodomonas_salina.2
MEISILWYPGGYCIGSGLGSSNDVPASSSRERHSTVLSNGLSSARAIFQVTSPTSRTSSARRSLLAMGAGDQQTPAAASGAKPTSTPTIYVKLVKADGLREHLGKPPTASMLLRVSVGGHAQEQVLRSKGVSASHSPQWFGDDLAS